MSQFKNPYEDKSVILAPISDEIQGDSNLEPQFVRKRHGNESLINLDNYYRNELDDPNDLILGGGRGVATLFTRKIKRFAVDFAGFFGKMHNVNLRNNTLIYEYNAPGNRVIIVLPEGVYGTVKLLMDELIAQLNTTTGTSGITFSWSQPLDSSGNVIQPYTAIITGVGGTFRFYDEATGLTSEMVDRGVHLINLERSNTFTSTKRAGQILLYYTRYVDLLSNSLNQWTKNPNSDNSERGAHNQLIRIIINPSGIPTGILPLYDVSTKNWIDFNRNQTLTNIDLRWEDEFGDVLYTPDVGFPAGSNTASNFSWLVELISEL